jgi:hypothetical protein
MHGGKMEKYIELLRIIKEQSGWTTYQLDDSSIILWLVTPIVIGVMLVTFAMTFVKSENMNSITSKGIFTLVVVSFIGVLSYLGGNIQVHYYRQGKAVINVVTNLSTDDYINLQKHVQLYGKNHIDDKELREISKLLRQEFFPENRYMNKGD